MVKRIELNDGHIGITGDGSEIAPFVEHVNVDVLPGVALTSMSPGILDITRHYVSVNVTISQGAALSGEIDASQHAGGHIHVPAVWTAGNIGFKVSPTSGGTFVNLRDALGSIVQISGIKTDGARAYALPDEVYGAGFIKLWSKSAVSATDTDVNQAAARSLVVTLKG